MELAYYDDLMRTDRTQTALLDSPSVSFIPEPQIYNLSVVQLSGRALPNMHEALGLVPGTIKKKEKKNNQDKKKKTNQTF